MNEEVRANEELVRQNPFFQLFSLMQIKRLSNKMQEMHLIRNQFVFQQGKAPTHVYMVLDGEFEILRRSRINVCRPKSNFMSSRGSLGRIGVLGPSQCQDAHRTSQNLIHQRKHPVQDFTITTVGRGQLLGLEDVVKSRTNTTSLRCIS